MAMFKVESDSPLTAWGQVERDLRRRIADEEFPAGSVAHSPGPGMTPATPEFSTLAPGTSAESNTAEQGKKRLLLNVKSSSIVDMSKEELVRKILRPWFAQLSLQCFKREYSMGVVDWEGCRVGLLEELFEEQTMVG